MCFSFLSFILGCIKCVFLISSILGFLSFFFLIERKGLVHTINGHKPKKKKELRQVLDLPTYFSAAYGPSQFNKVNSHFFSNAKRAI